MPKVSIIVPIYNVEQYLDKCISSILNQTYSDFELILVDDGSTDHCAQMCDCYAARDQRVFVVHKENGGQSDARNIGLKRAKGDYILFVDSDDSIRNTLLEDTVSIAEQEQIDIVLFDFISVDSQGNCLARYPINLPVRQIINIYNHPEILITSPSPINKLFRHSLFLNTGLQFPVGFWYEDLRTTPKLLACAKRVYYYNRVEYYYLRRQGSTMNNENITKNYHDRTAAIQDLLSYFQARGLYQSLFPELEAIATLQGYFYPCREIILINSKSGYLGELRKHLQKLFPDFKKNRYINQLTSKEKLIFFLLYHRQYRIISFGSKIKGFLRGRRNG